MGLNLAVRPFCINLFERRHHILTYETGGSLGPDEIRTLIEQSLDGDKALDITTIPLTDQAALADYMIIASGTSSRHVAAMAEKLKDRLEVRGLRNMRMEGLARADWVAIDAGDVIVHLFRPEVRAFYNIEKMWAASADMSAPEIRVQA